MAIPSVASQPLVPQPPIEENRSCLSILIYKIQRAFVRFYEWFKALFIDSHLERIARIGRRDQYIYFDHTKQGTIGFLNLDYPCPIATEEGQFYCAAAAYEASAFKDHPKIVQQFRNLNGFAARKLAETYKAQKSPQWHTYNLQRMKSILRDKFANHPLEKQRLLATEGSYLACIENDVLWGDTRKRPGYNALGHMLMQIRGELGGVGDIVQPPQNYRKIFNSDAS